MAFTFQKNENLEFERDEALLQKAQECTPEFYEQIISDYQLGELKEDFTKLDHCSVEPLKDGLESYELKKNDSIILDFKNHQVGYFSLDLDCVGSPMDAPLYLRFRFAQMPCELKYDSKDYDGWLASGWIQEEFIHIDELPCRLELPRRYAFRYVEIKVLDTSPKWQVVMKNAHVRYVSTANVSNLKPIHILDTDLQKIYDTGVKTLQDCMSDVFEDGPKRDRRLWLGDLKMQALANYASFDQSSLVKRCLYLFAGARAKDGRISANLFTKPRVIADDTFLFDYSLFFIGTLYDYLQVHEGQTLLQDLYPVAKKQMDLSLKFVNEQGCFIEDESYPLFIDWSQDFTKEVCGQAILIITLKAFIDLSTKMNQPTGSYEAILQKMRQYSLQKQFDADKGFFVCKDGSVNLATQSWMCLAHILDDASNKVLMEKAIEMFFPVRNIATPYMYSYITEALFEAGLKEEAVSLMKDYWLKMIELGADTYWEAFMPSDPAFSPYGHAMILSYCHAWGCAPVYLIPKYLPELISNSE